MPDYKKKKKRYKPIKKSRYTVDTDDIRLHDQDRPKRYPKRAGSDIQPPRLIRGKKQKRVAGAKVIAVFLAVIIAAVLILKLLFPVGIIETGTHFFKTLGVGDYPFEIAGNGIADVSLESDHYYILTDSQLYFVTNSGKNVATISHGYNNPMIKSSTTRALVFGQGKNEYDVYVNGEKKISESAENGIICGDISDSGVYAVASYSKAYASTVSVYSANGKSLFSWNSANDIITSVALSNNGKRLAVSAVNAVNGKKYTKVHIFNFKSTDAEKTLTFDDEFAYGLTPTSKGFFVLLSNSVTFTDWNCKKQTAQKSDYRTRFVKSDNKYSVAVFTREDNDNDNVLYLLDKNGAKVVRFTYKGTVKDVAVKGKNVYLYGNGTVTLFDAEGKAAAAAECNNLGQKLVPLGTDRVCIVGDTVASTCEFN